MKAFGLWLVLIVALFSVGCGGGGAGGGTTFELSGVIENIGTGGAPNPGAALSSGGVSGTTGVDGSFTLRVPQGTNLLQVVYTPPGGSAVTFQFSFDPITGNLDLGTLLVGPQQVSISGRVLNQETSVAVPTATIRFGGNRTTSTNDGTFVLNGVAFDPAQPTTFLDVQGRVGKAGFFPRVFFPSGTPVAGTLALGDILLQPDTGIAPPGTPFNIEGIVGPAGVGAGATVELRQGGTLVRSFTTTSTRTYGFWVDPGTYSLRATRGTLSSTDVTVILPDPTATVRRDLTLE